MLDRKGTVFFAGFHAVDGACTHIGQLVQKGLGFGFREQQFQFNIRTKLGVPDDAFKLYYFLQP